MRVKQCEVLIQRVEQAILLIRGRKVMMDADLAGFYGVSTAALKRAVRRNRLRRLVHGALMAYPPHCEGSCWLVFSLKPGSVDAEEPLLLGECLLLLHKAGLRDEHPDPPGAGGSQH